MHGLAFRAASGEGRRPARASGSASTPILQPCRAMRRKWPQQPLTPAVVLPNDGAPFAALNPLRNAPPPLQSRERSGPKARESERFSVNTNCPALPSREPEVAEETAHSDRRSAERRHPVRGSEPASQCTVWLSEPRARRAEGPRERAVQRQRNLSGFARPCAGGGRSNRSLRPSFCRTAAPRSRL